MKMTHRHSGDFRNNEKIPWIAFFLTNLKTDEINNFLEKHALQKLVMKKEKTMNKPTFF